MNLIKDNLYRHKENGQYLRLTAVAGGFCTARSDNGQHTWRGPESIFQREFTEVNIAYAGTGQAGPSEHK